MDRGDGSRDWIYGIGSAINAGNGLIKSRATLLEEIGTLIQIPKIPVGAVRHSDAY